jgi:hypothetical protein
LAGRFARRFAASQHPDGYWPEGHAPVNIYHMVSLAALGRVAILKPDPTLTQAVQRAAAYAERVVHPDGTFVSLVDGRSPHASAPSARALHAFSHLPRDRGFARWLVDARLQHATPLEGEEAANWLASSLLWRRGPETPYRPWSGGRALGSYAWFRRAHGWQLSFAVTPRALLARNQFMLDYQRIFSLWHARTGVLLSGAQDKHCPEHNTFSARRSADLGTLVGGRIGSEVSPPYVEAEYDCGIVGRVEVDLRDGRSAEILATARGGRLPPGFSLNLPLTVRIGETVCVGRAEHRLTRRRLRLRLRPGQTLRLEDRGVSVTVRAAGEVVFPCYPYNPYGPPPNRCGIDHAFLRLTLPLQGKPSLARCRIVLSR